MILFILPHRTTRAFLIDDFAIASNRARLDARPRSEAEGPLGIIATYVTIIGKQRVGGDLRGDAGAVSFR